MQVATSHPSRAWMTPLEERRLLEERRSNLTLTPLARRSETWSAYVAGRGRALLAEVRVVTSSAGLKRHCWRRGATRCGWTKRTSLAGLML
jgi:hypothetical protein